MADELNDSNGRVQSNGGWWVDASKDPPDSKQEKGTKTRTAPSNRGYLQTGFDGSPMGPWNNHIKCSCGEHVR